MTEPTQWWFTIKDGDYDLTQLQAKKRYEITKARKYCNTFQINPFDYLDELFDCYKESFTAYSKHFGVGDIDYSNFVKYITFLNNEGCNHFYATFFKESYRFPFGLIVKMLKPFMKFFEYSENPFLYNIYCVLKMDSFKNAL